MSEPVSNADELDRLRAEVDGNDLLIDLLRAEVKRLNSQVEELGTVRLFPLNGVSTSATPKEEGE